MALVTAAVSTQAATADAARQPTPNFTGLSTEIRCEVYKYLFAEVGIVQTVAFSRGQKEPVTLNEVKPRHHLAILRVCKNGKKEAEEFAATCPITLTLASYNAWPAHLPTKLTNRVHLVKKPVSFDVVASTLFLYKLQYPELRVFEIGLPHGLDSVVGLCLSVEQYDSIVSSGVTPCDVGQSLRRQIERQMARHEYQDTAVVNLVSKGNLALELPCWFLKDVSTASDQSRHPSDPRFLRDDIRAKVLALGVSLSSCYKTTPVADCRKILFWNASGVRVVKVKDMKKEFEDIAEEKERKGLQ